jgi:sec-independent protein translocase protein TatA
MFTGADAPWHWFIIAVLVVVLFGYKKLPDAARSLGRSLRIFKTEIKGMGEDDRQRDSAERAKLDGTAGQVAETGTPPAPVTNPVAPPAASPAAATPPAAAAPASTEQPQSSAD